MNFELSGKLISKEDTVKITDAFQKREFVVETSRDVNGKVFTDYIKLELTQDKCSLLDGLNKEDIITVGVNVRGRKYEKEGQVKYFNSLSAWKISKGATQDAPKVNQPVASEQTDDLPF